MTDPPTLSFLNELGHPFHLSRADVDRWMASEDRETRARMYELVSQTKSAEPLMGKNWMLCTTPPLTYWDYKPFVLRHLRAEVDRGDVAAALELADWIRSWWLADSLADSERTALRSWLEEAIRTMTSAGREALVERTMAALYEDVELSYWFRGWQEQDDLCGAAPRAPVVKESPYLEELEGNASPRIDRLVRSHIRLKGEAGWAELPRLCRKGMFPGCDIISVAQENRTPERLGFLREVVTNKTKTQLTRASALSGLDDYLQDGLPLERDHSAMFELLSSGKNTLVIFALESWKRRLARCAGISADPRNHEAFSKFVEGDSNAYRGHSREYAISISAAIQPPPIDGWIKLLSDKNGDVADAAAKRLGCRSRPERTPLLIRQAPC